VMVIVIAVVFVVAVTVVLSYGDGG